MTGWEQSQDEAEQLAAATQTVIERQRPRQPRPTVAQRIRRIVRRRT